MTITKKRILLPDGYIEFALAEADEATAYRDTNHPGCAIIEVTEDVKES